MGLKVSTVISIASFFILIVNTQLHAGCGHCCMGHHNMKVVDKSVSVKDSAAITAFKEKNKNVFSEIKILEEKIKKEYSAEKPDYDKIAELKKEVIDHHLKLEKEAAQHKDLKHHHCWCPHHMDTESK